MDEALKTINAMLSLHLGPTCRGDELKGVQPDIDDDDGSGRGVCSLYLDKRDLVKLAAAFTTLAKAMREPMTTEEFYAYMRENS